jgi:hypothetical protein
MFLAVLMRLGFFGLALCASPCYSGLAHVAGEQSQSQREVASLTERVRTESCAWERLPLAIPVFVRSRDDKGKEFLEFATALNIGGGGALIALRRALPQSARVLLEIPSAPLAASTTLPKSSRTLRARAVRVTHADGYHLLGLKFARPLTAPAETKALAVRRKVASSV